MRTMFSNYLVGQGYVDPKEAQQTNNNTQSLTEMIGALALRYGLMALDHDQIPTGFNIQM